MDQPITTSLKLRGAAPPQSAGAVLMVRPAGFGFNIQTAGSNAFQTGLDDQRSEHETQRLALREFDDLAELLRRAGVQVTVAEDSALPVKPDAVFPNNWVSFHDDGTVVLYPLLATNRRLERRDEVLRVVTREGGYHVREIVDLSVREADGKFLEGTGSLVLDRVDRVAYAGISPRTDLDVLGEFGQRLDYRLVTFEAADAAATPVYHTNVMMAIGSRFAVVCGAAIVQTAHRAAVTHTLHASGHEVIDLSFTQMHSFAGNLLELATPNGAVIALSWTAWSSLDSHQRRRLEAHGTVVTAHIPVIERLGGGSVRCMLAEIHLPKRRSDGMA